MNHDNRPSVTDPRAFEPPVAKLYCADARLARFFEIELAHLGIKPAAEAAAPLCLIVADGDAQSLPDLLDEAAAAGCPLLVFGFGAAELPAEAGEFIRRPFALPALEGALRRLLAGATTTAAPLATPETAVPVAHVAPAEAAPLTLSPEGDAALIGDLRVSLTPAEAAILRRLLEHRAARPGETVSREELSTLLGGGGNSVDVYVCHLRRKIEKPLGRRMITTVRGMGYVLE